MTSRRNFLQTTAVVTAGLSLLNSGAEAKTKEAKAILPILVDKLTDETGKFVLQPLPFGYDALEPIIDAKTVELHYNNHHKPAVAAANKAKDALAQARDSGDYSLVKFYEKELALNLSSHTLHTLYWSGLSSQKSAPSDILQKAIEKSFGSFDKFKAQLIAATIAVEASGWGILGYLPTTGELTILQVENHQKLTVWGIQPILVLDVWEHAYYLKYQNRRADYVNGLFGIINWDNVSARYNAATRAI